MQRLGLLLLSYAVYALIVGPATAAVFMLLFVCHEGGHRYEANRQQLAHGGITFYPLVGALLVLHQMPRSAADEARLGIMGPLWGSVALVPVGLAAALVDESWLTAAVALGAILNLANLLPVSPLDGGRVMAAIDPRLWVVGWVGLLALFLWRPTLITAVLLPLAGSESYRRLQERHDADYAEYYRTSAHESRVYGALLVGLACVLGVVLHHTWPSLEAVLGSGT